MSNLLVTGATGFLGSHLVSHLSAREGVRVFGVSRHGGRAGEVEVGAVDLELPGALAAWAGDIALDGIFHLAAILPSPGAADTESLLEANLRTTANVLALARERQAFMVYASSAFIYGPDAPTPITEEALPAPRSYYHASKYQGELLCRSGTESGMPSACLRIAAPYGAGQRTRTVLRRFVDGALASDDLTVYGSGRRTQDFIHVSDVAHAMWQAFTARAEGVYNIASGTSISMLDLARLVLRCVPDSSSAIRLPGLPDPEEDVRWSFSIDRARTAFGFRPNISLPDGIMRLISNS